MRSFWECIKRNWLVRILFDGVVWTIAKMFFESLWKLLHMDFHYFSILVLMIEEHFWNILLVAGFIVIIVFEYRRERRRRIKEGHPSYAKETQEFMQKAHDEKRADVIKKFKESNSL
jgi:type III secretory pathway component EscU